MLQLHGIDVWIQSGNEDLPMYQEEVEGLGSISAYIASHEGKQFKVAQRNNTADDFSYQILLDGHKVGSWLSRRGCHGTVEGMHVKEDVVRPFEFATLQITDEEDIGLLRPDVSKLGVIEIQFFRVVITGTNLDPMIFHSAFSTEAVSEKAKKVGWHRTSLAPEKKVQTQPRMRAEYLDHVPYITFSIRYQPEDLLKAHGIMPMPPPRPVNTTIPPTTSSGNKRPRSPNAGPSGERRDNRQNGSNLSTSGPSSPPKVAKPEPQDDDVLEIGDDSDDEEIQRIKAELAKARRKKQRKDIVKSERAHSPIVIGDAGDVIDLTLD
ncbi:uncharacterized protein STEHIDRAFT_122165 [Stereum hirsutum FP-91666 SS1]|uniref:uncharacterized protein n=1 Tax=Stereum hirsutum (strain FP-91666) TaxID=721885 RepID=UPI00044498C5|nr:uncharacterized protein STEHIDRAFT_122165 [Stereum hirsutum FP-91666 SS1]EIM86218.1 hypothetical protein STEHIDRAFT_122165 [Stereum hirsutum FP-91666 SS1]